MAGYFASPDRRSATPKSCLFVFESNQRVLNYLKRTFSATYDLKLFSEEHSHQPRTEHWLLSVTYYLNPKQVSDQAKIYPQYEFINPLGLTITEFHENRVSVDAIAPGSTGANLNAIMQPSVGAAQ